MLTQTLEETEKSPPDGGWTDKEIETFTRRMARFEKIGMAQVNAEKLAEQMLHRDRPESGDDRRICIECARFKKGACSKIGMLALPTILQRCEEFAMRGAHA